MGMYRVFVSVLNPIALPQAYALVVSLLQSFIIPFLIAYSLGVDELGRWVFAGSVASLLIHDYGYTQVVTVKCQDMKTKSQCVSMMVFLREYFFFALRRVILLNLILAIVLAYTLFGLHSKSDYLRLCILFMSHASLGIILFIIESFYIANRNFSRGKIRTTSIQLIEGLAILCCVLLSVKMMIIVLIMIAIRLILLLVFYSSTREYGELRLSRTRDKIWTHESKAVGKLARANYFTGFSSSILPNSGLNLVIKTIGGDQLLGTIALLKNLAGMVRLSYQWLFSGELYQLSELIGDKNANQAKVYLRSILMVHLVLASFSSVFVLIAGPRLISSLKNVEFSHALLAFFILGNLFDVVWTTLALIFYARNDFHGVTLRIFSSNLLSILIIYLLLETMGIAVIPIAFLIIDLVMIPYTLKSVRGLR